MKITITKQIQESINKLGNKTAQRSGLLIYCALYNLNKRKRSNGYFDAPSTYLVAINKRYNRAIDQFMKDGIIIYQTNLKTNPDSIFGNDIITKNYSTKHGYSMKYKFLVPIDEFEIEVDFKTTKDEPWYIKIKESLEILGYYDEKITRDSFGRRVHYNLLYNYKNELKGKKLWVIDSVCSQPRLLWLLMKKRGLLDSNYNDIFENDKDFYDYLQLKLNLEDRPDAKRLFMFWINSSGYVPNNEIHNLFPEVSKFLSKLKNRSYKDSSAYLQREEAKIWIDDLLSNVPTKFALTIHDSLIVKAEDAEMIKKYCQDKYPDLRFDMKKL